MYNTLGTRQGSCIVHAVAHFVDLGHDPRWRSNDTIIYTADFAAASVLQSPVCCISHQTHSLRRATLGGVVVLQFVAIAACQAVIGEVWHIYRESNLSSMASAI